MDHDFEDLDEFWPFYVSQHRDAANRRLHFLGTAGGLALLDWAIYIERLWPLSAGLAFAYGCAWIGHFFFEKNQPATFQYALFSFLADFRMFRLMALGRMDAEIERLREPEQ